MSSENTNHNNNDKGKITAGATVLASVLAVPITLLASLLLSNKRKK
jgi:hypothetical protein